MLDLGWSEILIIGVVALIVVGPKDLPRMLRTLGQFAGRARGIAREFQRSMDEAARQADMDELKDVKKSLDDLRDDQYRMQREMGQSFLEGSSKAKKTVNPMTEKMAEAAKPATDAVAKGTAAKDKAAPAKKPAAKRTAKPSEKSAAKPEKKPAEKAPGS